MHHQSPMTVTLMPAATTQLEAMSVHVCQDLKAMEHSALVTSHNTRQLTLILVQFHTDVDECSLGLHTCVNADCVNIHGSYNCSLCHPGFTGDGMPCSKLHRVHLEHSNKYYNYLLLDIACTNGGVRLMNGSDHTSTLGVGRVEICYNNSYWSVCDDRWDILDAGVVCRQLDEHNASEVDERKA